MNVFERMSNGWTIAMNSFKVLRENKKLILFPILSGISIVLVLGSFVVAILNTNILESDSGDGSRNRDMLYYLILFGFYLVNYFIVVFFNMALIHCSRLYFQGEEVTIKKGLQFSMSRLPSIFAWSVVAATVGLVLRMIQENVGTVGKIITSIIGIMWSIATFFVVPVIAYENAGPIEAIKRSSKLMKEKWGQSLAANFSFGLIQFIGILIVAIPLYFAGSVIDPMVGVALAFAGIMIVISIISAAQTIFISAVYHNITGDPVEHFNNQMIDNLFETK